MLLSDEFLSSDPLQELTFLIGKLKYDIIWAELSLIFSGIPGDYWDALGTHLELRGDICGRENVVASNHDQLCRVWVKSYGNGF